MNILYDEMENCLLNWTQLTLLLNFIMHVIFEHDDLTVQELLVQCPCCHDSVITILLSTISKYLLSKVLITLSG